VKPCARGPIVCDLTQIPAENRERLFRELRSTFGRARAALVLAEGFALEFPSEHGIMASLGEIIEYDRRCCPFIRHVLIDEPWGGPIRLELTGPPEVRDFLAEELLRVLPPHLTFTVADG
jgi:hypothetical protein